MKMRMDFKKCMVALLKSKKVWHYGFEEIERYIQNRSVFSPENSLFKLTLTESATFTSHLKLIDEDENGLQKMYGTHCFTQLI